MNKPFNKLTAEEWELLCDGCAQCCLHKLEDEDTGDIYFTKVVCRLLDLETGLCTNYEQRHILNPECIALDPEVVKRLHWLPDTCAYRCLAFDNPLPDWHPLLTDDPNSTVASGHSVLGKVLSENDIDMSKLEEYIAEDDQETDQNQD